MDKIEILFAPGVARVAEPAVVVVRAMKADGRPTYDTGPHHERGLETKVCVVVRPAVGWAGVTVPVIIGVHVILGRDHIADAKITHAVVYIVDFGHSVLLSKNRLNERQDMDPNAYIISDL